jgi:hypothetical protein
MKRKFLTITAGLAARWPRLSRPHGVAIKACSTLNPSQPIKVW